MKKLIRLGASVNTADLKNRKPIDIAINRKNHNIVEILRDSISINSCKFVSGRAVDNDKFPILFYGYFTFNELFCLLVPLPFIGSRFMIGFSIASYIILFVLYTYMLRYADAGYKASSNTLRKLLDEDANLNEYCPICVCTVKNSIHCYYCNKCVDSMDHHCMWIKKCIGKKNLNQFFLFLLWTFIKLFITAGISIYSNHNLI